MISRRQFLVSTALGAGLAATRCLAASESLGSAARRSGRFFGSAVRVGQLLDGSEYAALVRRECTSLTPELELKWAAVEPVRGQLSVAALDDIAEFAELNGMKLHGHTLLWHESVPGWAAEGLARGEWIGIERYMASVMPRLGAAVEYWDVVNEPIETGHRFDGLRDNIFLRGFGPDYIRRALDTARIFQPKGKLLINEYGLEYDIQTEEFRRYHFLKLIESLMASSAPLDGIGLQSHLDLRKGRISQSTTSTFLREISQFGLDIIVTELDVHEADYIASAEVRDQTVADETERYLDAVLDNPAVKGVSTWSLSDRFSWLDITESDLASYKNAWTDGTGPGLNRGLPFDASLRAKPMYSAILNAFGRH